jgi:hypothetical protein
MVRACSMLAASRPARAPRRPRRPRGRADLDRHVQGGRRRGGAGCRSRGRQRRLGALTRPDAGERDRPKQCRVHFDAQSRGQRRQRRARGPLPAGRVGARRWRRGGRRRPGGVRRAGGGRRDSPRPPDRRSGYRFRQNSRAESGSVTPPRGAQGPTGLRGLPLLLGTSRKSVIGLTLDLPVEERLEGTGPGHRLGSVDENW